MQGAAAPGFNDMKITGGVQTPGEILEINIIVLTQSPVFDVEDDTDT